MHYYYLSPEDYVEAAKNGISEATVYKRVYAYGWNVRRAISTPVKQKSKTGWAEWKETAKKNKIPYPTFQSRVNVGWSPEKAACTPQLK